MEGRLKRLKPKKKKKGIITNYDVCYDRSELSAKAGNSRWRTVVKAVNGTSEDFFWGGLKL